MLRSDVGQDNKKIREEYKVALLLSLFFIFLGLFGLIVDYLGVKGFAILFSLFFGAGLCGAIYSLLGLKRGETFMPCCASKKKKTVKKK